MPTEAKQATVAQLNEDLSSGGAGDRRRLPRADGRRSAARSAAAARAGASRTRVVKNRLARIAAEQAGRAELDALARWPDARS